MLGGSSERLAGLLELTAGEYGELQGRTDKMRVATEANIESVVNARREIKALVNDAIVVVIQAVAGLVEGWKTLTDAWNASSPTQKRIAVETGYTEQQVRTLGESLGGGDGLFGKLKTYFTSTKQWNTVERENQDAIFKTTEEIIAQSAALEEHDRHFRDLRTRAVEAATGQQEYSREADAARLATIGVSDQLDFYRMGIIETKSELGAMTDELRTLTGKDWNMRVNIEFNLPETILAELANFWQMGGNIEAADSARSLYRAITRAAGRQGVRGNLFGTQTDDTTETPTESDDSTSRSPSAPRGARIEGPGRGQAERARFAGSVNRRFSDYGDLFTDRAFGRITEGFDRDESIQHDIQHAIEEGRDLSAEQIGYLERGETYAQEQIANTQSLIDRQVSDADSLKQLYIDIEEHQKQRDNEMLDQMKKAAEALTARRSAHLGAAADAGVLGALVNAAEREGTTIFGASHFQGTNLAQPPISGELESRW